MLDLEQHRRWVEQWRIAGPKLEEIRREELRNVDVARAIAILNDAYESARRTSLPRITSGLVEQQRLFSKGRR